MSVCSCAAKFSPGSDTDIIWKLTEIFLITAIFELEKMSRADDFECVLTVIIGDHVQTVEQLSLVFMDSLDLNVEHGVWVDLHLIVLLQVHRELQLVFLCYQNMTNCVVICTVCAA